MTDVHAQLEALRAAVIPCSLCHGTGIFRTACTLCYSTFDHMCNDSEVPCPDKRCGALRKVLADIAAAGDAWRAEHRKEVLREARAALTAPQGRYFEWASCINTIDALLGDPICTCTVYQKNPDCPRHK